MKGKKILVGIFTAFTVLIALVLGVYLVATMTEWLPFLAPYVAILPSWTLYAIAGALGVFLILTIVFGVLPKKYAKEDEEESEDEEVEEVEHSDDQIEEIEEPAQEEPQEEVQEVEAEAEAEEVKEEEPQETAPVEEESQEEEPVEAAPIEEEKEEEPVEAAPVEEEAQEEEPVEAAPIEEEPKAEEPQQEEEQPQEAQEEQPEEKEQMVAEENVEAKAAPIAAAVEEVKEEPIKKEAPQEEIKQEQVKEEVTPTVAAFISDQQKLNENIEKRLEGIDNSLKIIADALKSLLYDAVPAGVANVSVSTHEAAPEPVEDDVADGGNYFEQVEQEQQIEEQNAEIAENYAEGWIATADQDSRIKPKMSFEMRLRVADEDIKKFYSEIKNELLSYGIHDRISRHRENFNQGRINICRMVINGKTLKIYLAVDPESIDKRYFHHTDVGHRKGLVELPTMINVRSKVAARKVKELITLMMESLVISKKPYEEHDFAKDLTAEGFTTVECKGYDYLVEKSMTLDKAKEYPDSFAAQLIEMVEDNEYQERFIKTSLTLDEVAEHFKDGDIIDIDKVRELGIGPANSNFLSIKESKKISKKFKIYANEYTPDAVKMICLAGGEAFLVIQPEKTIEEV